MRVFPREKFIYFAGDRTVDFILFAGAKIVVAPFAKTRKHGGKRFGTDVAKEGGGPPVGTNRAVGELRPGAKPRLTSFV